jgi:hypothetical protein
MRFIFILSLTIFFPQLSNAQFDELMSDPATMAPQQEIFLTPELPEPGESVTASLNTNVIEGEIVWLLNGLEIENSQNLREVDFTASGAGNADVIRAVVSRDGLVLANLEKTITPRHVDIIIEPQTHSPEFYRGRSLASPGSLVNATVLISGINDYSNLIFNWRLDLDVIGNGRSLGRNAVSFETGIRPDPLLSVEVFDLNGNKIAADTMIIANEQPFIKFYVASTLLGLNNTPINGTWNMVSNTGTLRAVPYNIDSRVYNNPDIIEWEIDGTQYNNTGSNPYEITLQKNSDGGGRSQLNFHVRDTRDLLQGGRANININL